jgi:hypothetical protein
MLEQPVKLSDKAMGVKLRNFSTFIGGRLKCPWDIRVKKREKGK